MPLPRPGRFEQASELIGYDLGSCLEGPQKHWTTLPKPKSLFLSPAGPVGTAEERFRPNFPGTQLGGVALGAAGALAFRRRATGSSTGPSHVASETGGMTAILGLDGQTVKPCARSLLPAWASGQLEFTVPDCCQWRVPGPRPWVLYPKAGSKELSTQRVGPFHSD